MSIIKALGKSGLNLQAGSDYYFGKCIIFNFFLFYDEQSSKE